MMTSPAHFKQADATKALKAVTKAGLTPRALTIAPDGSMKVELLDDAAEPRRNPLDRILHQ